MAKGPDGNVWACASDSNLIGRITPTGTITEFSIPTALSGPVFIAAGPDNTIWFTEGSSNKIGELFL